MWKSLDMFAKIVLYSVRLPQTVTEARTHHTHVSRVTERGSTTEPEDNTMLNKVVVFVIFVPKCIFDASKNSN